MSDLEERTVTISGVKVIFPCKPYPSQFGMMDRVIKGIERGQNCLLESPTGSGKSLALLCSALAWQCAQHEKLTRELVAGETVEKECSCKTWQKSDNGSADTCCSKTPHKMTGKLDSTGICEDDEDDDFQSDFKPRVSTGQKRRHVGIEYETGAPAGGQCGKDGSGDGPCDVCTCSTDAVSTKKQRVPRIYFGTRTHKQIAQITRELKKTAYHDVRMAILASREYTCIHPQLSKSKNKSEECRKRLDPMGPGCTFYDKTKRVFLHQHQIQEGGLASAWDLEDFVALCKTKKTCPYFVTRNIVNQADIVFCPYNYLVDPLVRGSMEINLKDQIVILDEAHNIEDSSRDAASGTLTTEQLSQAIHNLQDLLDRNVKFIEHLKLKNMLENVSRFITENTSNLEQRDYDKAYKVWSGFDIVVRLKSLGLGPDTFSEYQDCLEHVTAKEEDQESVMRNRQSGEDKMSSQTQKTMEQLFQVLDYMYRDDLKFVEDYRVAVMKYTSYQPVQQETNDRWLNHRRQSYGPTLVYALNFWCMNPAVAFSDFNVARNVILSSGTLSPMSSFQSELGVPFPIQLEANHVIQDKQVWVGTLGQGPSGATIQAVYKNMETFSFQDELGSLIHRVCMTVPHGVLCFLPSYRALENFTKRWKGTGLFDAIKKRKKIMMEPRASERTSFDDLMKRFYSVIKGDGDEHGYDDEDWEEDSGEIDGALFLAVCRGKVSEGLDFADNNARAVITVGIPFPSIKDVQVKLKKEYNDHYRAQRGLLSGNEWYEIQAFRALNQALGRCLRHRKDWGALIIVDDRFVKNKDRYTKGLSKWVRSKVQTFDSFSHSMKSLGGFAERMAVEMPLVTADTSFIPCTPVSQRRDSVYRPRASLSDESLTGTPTPNQEKSHYLTSPESCTKVKNLFKSPDSSASLPKGKHANKTPAKGDSCVGSPLLAKNASSFDQLVAIVDSPSAPKDKPYYVIIGQGTAAEQRYLIEPSAKQPDQLSSQTLPQNQHKAQHQSTVGSVSSPEPAQVKSGGVPVTPPPVTTGGSQLTPSQVSPGLLVPAVPGLPAGSVVLPNLTKQPMPRTIFINQQGQVINPGFVIGAQRPGLQNGQVVLSPPGSQPELVVSATGLQQPRIGLTRLTTAVSTGQKPTVVLPQPTAASVAKAAGTQLGSAAVSSSLTNSQQEDLDRKVSAITGARRTPVKPLPPISTANTSSSNTGCKHTPLKTSLTSTESGHSNIAEDKTRSSPDLFEGSPVKEPTVIVPSKSDSKVTGSDVQESETLAEAKSVTPTVVSGKGGKKRPIFRRTSLSKNKLEKPGVPSHSDSSTCDVVKDKPVEVKLEPKDTGALSNISNVSEKQKRWSARQPAGAQSAAEKLKRFRLGGEAQVHIQPKEKPADMTAADTDMLQQEETDSEEFVKTRRRTARKRLSTSALRRDSKKSRGVDFIDNIEPAKENQAMSSVSCDKCGTSLVENKEFEVGWKHPKFVRNVWKRHSEVLCFRQLDTNKKFRPLAATVTGVCLDCCWDKDSGCTLQYLQCAACSKARNADSTAIAVKIVTAPTTGSDFQQNQVWMLASAVRK